MANMTYDQEKELVSLVAWLQTFPEFGLFLYDGKESPEDVQRLHSSLCTIEAARAVSNVAEVVCGSSSHNIIDTNSEQLWTSLLIMTSNLARPLPKEARKDGNDNRITPTRLKLYVLGNLLDCAVQTQDLEERRFYIERIMGLKKNVQKILMSLIERRGPKRSNSANTNTPNGSASTAFQTSTTLSAGNKIDNHLQERDDINKKSGLSLSDSKSVRQQLNKYTTFTPPSFTSLSNFALKSSASLFSSDSHIYSKGSKTRAEQEHHKLDEEDTQTNSSSTTECMSNMSPGVSRKYLPCNNKTSRLFSPKSRNVHTPDEKGSFSGRSLLDNEEIVDLLSPGMMDSPSRLSDVINDLTLKNENFQHVIVDFKRREQEQALRMEEMEAEFRRKLMRAESNGLDQMHEIQLNAEEKIDSLTKDLEDARLQSQEGVAAMHELQIARDELEILSHGKGMLAETTEKLRKYREKAGELIDIKEALKREQDSHSKAVEEIVRLEYDLKNMQPLKRQVEDYKFRAVEAEVKLVECQAYLQRMENHVDEQNTKNRFLRNGAVMQKEQLEEMQRRIQQDTQVVPCEVSGVGDGISELNPELNQEMIRLRSENLQLRAFAAKRDTDAVQHLEESLEDTKRLADRYKQEYLSTKETLNGTKSSLEDSRALEHKRRNEIEELVLRVEKFQKQSDELYHQLSDCDVELENCKESLRKENEDNANIRSELNSWKKKNQDSEQISNERMERLRNVLSDLEETTNNLRSTEQLVQELREDISNWEVQSSNDSQQLQQLKRRNKQLTDELSECETKINDTEKRIQSLESQVNKLTAEKTILQDQLKIERKLRHEETNEAQQSLEATRAVLEARHKKEQEELQANMSRLLEDERRAVRSKEEEMMQMQLEVQNEWQSKYNELEKKSSAIINRIRDDAEVKENQQVREHQELITKERRESSETHDRLIRKGKAMLEDAKTKARDEILRLDTVVNELEDKIRRIEREKSDQENMLQRKISSLLQKLEFATGQVNSMSEEADECHSHIKLLEREKFQLHEDNDRFRRQLGGRYGADGKVQSTLENLQQEYNAILEENRKLKADAREGGQREAFFESFLDTGSSDDPSQTYQRGVGMNGRTLTELRQEYEETIESLNDEKRELIMRNSAAVTDVQKAEQRAWEREQEVSKLKGEITSLNLRLQRETFSRDQSSQGEAETNYQSPPYGKNLTPLRNTKINGSDTLVHQTYTSYVARQGRSPGVERALKQKAVQENALRNRFSSLIGIVPSQYSPSAREIPEAESIRHDENNYRLESRNEKETTDNSDFPNNPNLRESSNRIETPLESDNLQLAKSHSSTTVNVNEIDSPDLCHSKSSPNSSSCFSISDPSVEVKECPIEQSSTKSENPDWTIYHQQVGMRQQTSESTDSISKSASSLSSRSSSPELDVDRENDGLNCLKAQDSVREINSNETNNTDQGATIQSSLPRNTNKHEGRFDRFTQSNRWQSKQNISAVRNDLASTKLAPQKEHNISPTRINNDEPTPMKLIRRKSASIQKAASVFEANANKQFTPDKPSPIIKRTTPNKFINIKNRLDMGGAIPTSKLPLTTTNDQITNQFESPSSSAFKKASAVFEIAARSGKSLSKLPIQTAKSPLHPMHLRNLQSDTKKIDTVKSQASKESKPTADGEIYVPSIMDVTQVNKSASKIKGGDRPECKQS